METKTCTECQFERLETEFAVDEDQFDSIARVCEHCENEINKGE